MDKKANEKLDETIRALEQAPQKIEELKKKLYEKTNELNQMKQVLEATKLDYEQKTQTVFRDKIHNAHLKNKINELETRTIEKNLSNEKLFNEVSSMKINSQDLELKLSEQQIEQDLKLRDIESIKDRFHSHVTKVDDYVKNCVENDPELNKLRGLKESLIKKKVEKETFNQEVEFLKAKESILISSIDDLKQNIADRQVTNKFEDERVQDSKKKVELIQRQTELKEKLISKRNDLERKVHALKKDLNI